MKELKELKEVERCLVTSQCGQFFLTYYKYKSCIKIFNKIKTELSLSPAHDKEVWLFITCVARSLKSGVNGSEFSLSAPVYKKANNIHNLKLSHIRASRVINLLDKLGYIEYYKGYGTPFRYSYDWARGCVLFTDKLKFLFSGEVLSKIKTNLEPTQLVEIRDKESNKCILSYSKIKGVVPKRNFMLHYNNVLSKHKVEIFGNTCVVQYKQIFHGDLDSGGRIYSFGKFQTIKSEYRKHLTIDGEETTEVDLSNLHVSILRCLQGIPPVGNDFDQYTIEGYPRSVCKMAIMCMINCMTKRGASIALKNICDDNEDHPYTEDDCKEIIEKLLELNKPVIFFGKGSSDWKTLQRIDSSICEFVINCFIKDGFEEAILSYHDSWVVKRSCREHLIESISNAWKFIMKVDYNCKVKVEF